MSTGDIDVRSGPVAFLDVVDARANRGDFPGEFVADDQWQVRRRKPPFDDMGIGPADTAAMDPQQHLPRTWFWPFDFLEAKVIGAMKDRRLHRAQHRNTPSLAHPLSL